MEISQLQAYHKQFDSRATNTIVLGEGGGVIEPYVSRVSGLSLDYGVALCQLIRSIYRLQRQ